MKIQCIDTHSPRTDGRKGPPSGITLGKTYQVAEVLNNTSQYSLVNDEFRMSRYSQSRFEIIDDSPVVPLREAFNTLTTEMRTRIKQLEIQILKGEKQ